MFGHNTAYTLSVGQRSPFPFPRMGGDGASLIADAVAPLLVVRFTGLNATDLTLFSSGRIDVALTSEGNSAVFQWAFSSPGCGSAAFETPFHAGLERASALPDLSTDGLAPGEGRLICLVVQDESDIVRLIRPISLPHAILDAFAPLLVRQIDERRGRTLHKVRKKHQEALERYNQRWADPMQAMSAAPVMARAA